MILFQKILQLAKLERLLSHSLQHFQVLYILQPLQYLPVFINVQNDCRRLAFAENNFRCLSLALAAHTFISRPGS